MDEVTSSRIDTRLEELEQSLERALEDGADPDSYNVGWLEGAIHGLTRLVSPVASR